MPQLLLHPWFSTFMITWLSILIFSPKKVLHHTPSPSFIFNLLAHKTNPWPWPWH